MSKIKFDTKRGLNTVCYVLIFVHAFQAATFVFAKRQDFEYELNCFGNIVKLTERNVAKGFLICIAPLIVIIGVFIFFTENCQLWYKTWLKTDCFISFFMIGNIIIEQKLLKMREKLLGLHIVSRIHLEDHDRAEEMLDKLVKSKKQKEENRNGGDIPQNLKASMINLDEVLSEE
jgi:low affinity Fe/Cu permease